MNDITREQWLEERKTGIGGSDAAVVLGLSNWKTPYELWREKRGLAPAAPDTWLMRWGRAMDPELRQHYAEITGQPVFMAPSIVRHSAHPWMICTPDGGTHGRLLEIKISRSAEGWGEPGSDEIHPTYLPQCQHNMCVTGLEVCDVLFAVYGQEPRLYTVPADREIHAMLIEAEGRFWDYVMAGEPPDPVNFADVIARYGRHSVNGTVLADPKVLAAVSDLRDLRHMLDLSGAREDELKTVIMRALGEADTLVDADGKVLITWKQAQAAKRFDAKAFAIAHPELLAQFTRAGEPNRRFLLKG